MIPTIETFLFLFHSLNVRPNFTASVVFLLLAMVNFPLIKSFQCLVLHYVSHSIYLAELSTLVSPCTHCVRQTSDFR